ncbi:hypothetical protein JCM10213_009296 [Rhodosporidiobolus nylandii]
MCGSQASLFFGLWANSMSLCVAGRAWREIEPALRAVALIRLRRRNGTLETSTKKTGGMEATSVADLPDELWDLIAPAVVARALVEAENALVRDYHGEDDGCGCSACLRHRNSFSLAHLSACDTCMDTFLNDNGVSEALSEHEEGINALTAYFGLRLVSTEPASAEEWCDSDLDALSPVSLALSSPPTPAQSSAPLSSDKGHTRISMDVAHDTPYSSQKFVKLSPSTFSLPTNAAARFRRLFLLFPSLKHSYAKDKAMPTVEVAVKPGSKGAEKAKEGKETVEADAEPGWHLWTEAWQCY